MAFITSQGVLDAPSNAPIREYMMRNANLVGVARLPNNLFTDNAGTEVGSDLIILQKNSGKNGELYYNEKLFMQTEQTPIGTSVNGYVWSISSLSNTDLIRGTDLRETCLSTPAPGRHRANGGGLAGTSENRVASV